MHAGIQLIGGWERPLPGNRRVALEKRDQLTALWNHYRTSTGVINVLLTFVRQQKSRAAVQHVDGTILRQLDSSAVRARYWVKRTPRESVRLLHRARVYHIAGATLSIITGLAAWPVIADGSRFRAQVVISALACLAAVTIAAPYATGLHDRAEESIMLCGRYGAIYGELLRAQSQIGTQATTQHRVRELIQQFDDVATRRDALGLAAPAPDSGQASGEHSRSVQ
ncbi:hypothetical protein OG828_48795 [Streptomyces sp. NBC_00457]|uniref:hypothetical protein n=1 Tax=Streptomyces sp. NBC_00457 TaxID=2975748 RepID=UPI002E1BAD86